MAEVAAFQGIGNRVSGYHPLTKVSGAGAISNNPFLFDPGSSYAAPTPAPNHRVVVDYGDLGYQSLLETTTARYDSSTSSSTRDYSKEAEIIGNFHHALL